MRRTTISTLSAAMLILATPVFGDESFFCIEEGTLGYSFDKGRPERQIFPERRFSLRFMDGTRTALVTQDGNVNRYECSVKNGGQLSCHAFWHLLTYNLNTRDFATARLRGHVYENDGKRETTAISYGTCSPY